MVRSTLGILIYDNTPGGQHIECLPDNIRYEAAPKNPGLAEAYNRALTIASSEGFTWLLTLDQDTLLPPDFLSRIAGHARDVQDSSRLAAIVPQVVGDQRVLSPFQFVAGAVPKWSFSGYVGVPAEPVYAVNSASTLRVSLLREMGGYDRLFPLDVSDINLFHRFHRAGYTVFVAGDLIIHHELAMFKKNQRMSLARYESLLLDECAFWDLNMGSLARLERLVRLAGRVCKDLFSPDEAAFRKITLSELKRRLSTSRARRMADWKVWAEARATRSTEHIPS